MKRTIVSFLAGMILATAGVASAGVPDQIAELLSRVTDVEQTADTNSQRIDRLERKVLKKKHGHPVVICRVIAGQPLPDICR